MVLSLHGDEDSYCGLLNYGTRLSLVGRYQRFGVDFCPENEGSMFLQNFYAHLPEYAVS
jgi:hypothetical protein